MRNITQANGEDKVAVNFRRVYSYVAASWVGLTELFIQ